MWGPPEPDPELEFQVGDWRVRPDPEIPGMVEVSFVHCNDDGVERFAVALFPNEARHMSRSLQSAAKHIDGLG